MTIDLGPFPHAKGCQEALNADFSDPLRHYREAFAFPDPDLVYLDGNSLGRLPRQAVAVVDDVTRHQWGDRLIRSWNEGWWDLQLRLGEMIAPLVGAHPDEVIVSDSTSVNLFKLAMAAVESQSGRGIIVTDDLNFPTDVYVLEGVAGRTGSRLRVVPSDGVHGPVEALESAIDNDTALVSLSHTVFKSGYTYDMAEVTAMAHRVGAMILWDCSHSVGAVPIDLVGASVDLAVGCTYKYLHGGPGAPAFLYVRSDLQGTLENPINAWWGHADPFAFDLEFRPISGIRRFHTGTMPILSLAVAEPGIAMVAEAGLARIREKSLALGTYAVDQWDTHLRPLGFTLASPSNPESRGSHISIAYDDAWPVTQALIELGQVIPDFRAPDNIRLGLSPLYTGFLDVHTAVQRCRLIVENGLQERFADAPATVT